MASTLAAVSSCHNSTDSPNEGHNTAIDAPTEGQAATIIQRTYRGHRTRRLLDGHSITATDRWTEAVKEAQYRNLIRPRSRQDRPSSEKSQQPLNSSFAHQEWKRLAKIARRAGNDDTSESGASDGQNDPLRNEQRRRRFKEKREREELSKMMGLEYFLEMVDVKHRYGSHLRSYHVIWKQANTNENFFYWLDYGEGRDIQVPQCSREKLEQDQVRYLSREERYNYLVRIDEEGRLRYAKNNERVTTSWEYRDSLEGIVRHDDPTPSYREDKRGAHPERERVSGSGSELSSGSESDSSVKDGKYYVNQDLHDAKGIQKVQYVSAGALVNHLLQNTTKKNTWIFVADTSFRLYIGIKQSGAFQHSSFLHGARISAAGTLKVKDGLIRRLDPLSGHYRPPTKNFRAFVKTLKERGADLSRVSISKSYAVLLGVEGYMKTKKQARSGLQNIQMHTEKVFRPEDARKRADSARDKSESARKEREFLEKKAKEEREAKSARGMRRHFSGKLRFDDYFSPPGSPKPGAATPVKEKETITPPLGGATEPTPSEKPDET